MCRKHKYKNTNTKYTNTQIQHMTKCQKDLTCGIFLKTGLFKDIKNYIPMCPTQKYKYKYTNTAYEEVPERPSIWYIFENRNQSIIYVSSVYRQCILSTSSAHHQSIISASLVHHCSVFIAELCPFHYCLVLTIFNLVFSDNILLYIVGRWITLKIITTKKMSQVGMA